MLRRLEQLEARDVPAAKLQLINNSPAAAMAIVDVYVNNNLLLDNFPFQTATAFLDVASQTNLTIDIANASAPSNAMPIASASINLPDNSSTTAALLGEPGTSTFKLATATGRATSSNAGNVEFLTLNGTADVPTIDVRIRNVGVTSNDLGYGKYSSGYQSLTPAAQVADVLASNGKTVLAGANLDLASKAGSAFVLMTTGTATDLAYMGVFGDGTTVLFAPRYEPAYAVGSVTSKGGVAILSSSNGTTTQGAIAFPGATGAVRVASADLTGDGVPELIAGSGPGMVGLVRIFDGSTGTLLREVEPFGNFLGGVNVAAGDITGDGTPDYVISPDDGGGPRVRIFNGKTHDQIADFFGIDDVNFRGGARASIGDFDADGKGDLLVSAGLGGGPRVALFKGATLGSSGGPKFTGDFFAFEPDLRNGAFIAAGDVNGDGYSDLLVGGGPGGGPRVRAMDGKQLSTSGTQTVLADFFAGDVNDRRGVRLTAKDLDGDGKDDLITGSVPGSDAVTRTFLAKNLPLSGIATPTRTTNTLDGSAVLDEVFVG